ncbi:MAG TPA: ABC transporter permease subunit [Paenibacillus sp.]|jgi:putative aldouronate transport system permease protein
MQQIIRRLQLKYTWFFHLMVWPGLLLLFIFVYYPMVGITIAFQDYNPMKGFFLSPWNHFENFTFMFELPDTLSIIRNTIEISLMKIFAGLVVPIGFALMLNEVRTKWFKKSVQSFVYFPHFLSWVILGGILIDVLSVNGGAVNAVLSQLGIDPIYFLGNNFWFRVTLITTDVWKEFGFSTIVYLAALTGINPSLYEASAIDGASRWKQTMHVTLPGMMPVIILMSALSLGNVLNAGFDQIFNLYNQLVLEKSDIIDTYVYRIGLIQAQYGLATAIGLMKSVIGFVLIIISYRLAYRYANYRIF